MIMVRFDNVFPELAKLHMRRHVVDAGGPTAPGTYLWMEGYCIDPRCDCRRVTILVVHEETVHQVATISHRFAAKDASFPSEPQTVLDPINPQSNASEYFLEEFASLVSRDSDFRGQLIRHYALIKGTYRELPRRR